MFLRPIIQLFIYAFLLSGSPDFLYSQKGHESILATEIIEQRKENLTIGLICAHPKEMGELASLMSDVQITEEGSRCYYRGKLWGIDSVLVACRVGKVAAAATTAHLIGQFKVDLLFFIGVAGSAEKDLKIGDIVVANGLIQHDIDSSPLTPPFTVPLINIKTFRPDLFLQEKSHLASEIFIDHHLKSAVDSSILNLFHVQQPKVVGGIVASGDHFFADKQKLAALKQQLPEVQCVEMEGAAVAQVCYEYSVPYAILRIISDESDPKAGSDCLRFMQQVSPHYTKGILKELYQLLLAEIRSR